MIRLIVHGAHGRMGSRICSLALADGRFEIAAALGRGEAEPEAGAVGRCDVVIDFSSPDGAGRAAGIARNLGASLLVGTTGLPRETVALLEGAAASTAVMVAPNTSLGVAVLTRLAVEAARRLGRSFDVDLVEAHHSGKKDAPSGTALRIASALKAEAGRELPPERVHAIRAGDIVGEHEISFAGPGEVLTLRHAATTRDVFAHGALRAAAWLRGRPPGLYRIDDALGL